MAVSHTSKPCKVALTKDSKRVYEILNGWMTPWDNTCVLSVYDILFLVKNRKYSLLESFYELSEKGLISIKVSTNEKLTFTILPPRLKGSRDAKTGLPVTNKSLSPTESEELQKELETLFRQHVQDFIFSLVSGFSQTQKDSLQAMMIEDLQILKYWIDKIHQELRASVIDIISFDSLLKKYIDEYLLACPYSNGCDELLIDFFETVSNGKETI